MPWKSAIRLPNCLRSLTYSRATSSAPWAIPTAWAPMVTRVWSRVRKAIFRPSPSRADHAVAGDADVVEVQLAGRAALDAELALLLAEGEPLVGLLHDEGADVGAAPALGVGHREHRVVLGDTGVGDPGLLAVEYPVVAVARGAGPHRSGVAAGLALGQAVRERGRSLRERSEVALLELLRPARISGILPSLLTAGMSEDDAQTRATSSMTMHAASASAPTPPYSSGTCGAKKSRGDEGVVRLLRVRAVLVHLRGIRRDLVLGDRAHRLADRLVVLGDLEHVEVGVSGHGTCFFRG